MKATIEKALADDGTYVHLFTDDPIYRSMYEEIYGPEIAANKLSFGPHAARPDDYSVTSSKNRHQSPFKRTSSAQEAALDFTVMGLCNEFHGTSGSTVIHFVHWINAKYQKGPHLSSTIGNWSPGGATWAFRSQIHVIMQKSVDHIIIMEDFQLRHIQANVLDFLGKQHLSEIYKVISATLEQPPHKPLAATFVKDELLRKSNVAKMNREKYVAASRIAEGDEKSKGQHWLKALLRYRLKPYALTLPTPAWIFDVTDDGFIVRNPIQSHTSDGVVSDLPPWRTESSSSFSSTDRPWHEPETNKFRFTK